MEDFFGEVQVGRRSANIEHNSWRWNARLQPRKGLRYDARSGFDRSTGNMPQRLQVLLALDVVEIGLPGVGPKRTIRRYKTSAQRIRHDFDARPAAAGNIYAGGVAGINETVVFERLKTQRHDSVMRRLRRESVNPARQDQYVDMWRRRHLAGFAPDVVEANIRSGRGEDTERNSAAPLAAERKQTNAQSAIRRRTDANIIVPLWIRAAEFAQNTHGLFGNRAPGLALEKSIDQVGSAVEPYPLDDARSDIDEICRAHAAPPDTSAGARAAFSPQMRATRSRLILPRSLLGISETIYQLVGTFSATRRSTVQARSAWMLLAEPSFNTKATPTAPPA